MTRQCPECLHSMTRDGDWWVCSCGHRTDGRPPKHVAADGLAAARRAIRDASDG